MQLTRRITVAYLVAIYTAFGALLATCPAAKIVLLTGENEYGTAKTLPDFAKRELEPMGHRIFHVAAPEKDGEHRFENVEALKDADLIFISVRRRAPQQDVIDALRAHLAAGKPVVGLRTASHAFELRRGNPPPGHAVWPSFDVDVLGADYTGHEDNKPPKGPQTIITIDKASAAHPILTGQEPGGFKVTSHLYNNRDFQPGTKVLLHGRVEGQTETEPVAWTNTVGKSRIFYTSLGSQADFEVAAFRDLLRNGTQWALGAQAGAKWADWIEPDFLFFSSVLDARKDGATMGDNLTPRGLILPLGLGVWACFDVDLLRISAVWHGRGVTPRALAPGSYHVAGTKTVEGQANLPIPDGQVWLSNGLYPGVQLASRFAYTDPREPAPSAEEPGRGPLPLTNGRFESIELSGDTVRLRYHAASAEIIESWNAGGGAANPYVDRRLLFTSVPEPVVLIVGQPTAESPGHDVQLVTKGSAELARDGNKWLLRVPKSETAVDVVVRLYAGAAVPPFEDKTGQPKTPTAAARWPETIKTSGILSRHHHAYVVDDIPLPMTNPWQRNPRLADLAFLPNGTAAAVTFDGDIWMISGLSGNLENVMWRRFTSGLHEPQSIVARGNELFVFDRNGLWRIRDADHNGEADTHELFCNLIAQTAETREFANSLRLAPDGSFLVAKGGQQGTTLGKHNGTILRISPDGGKLEVIARGLRQSFIGVHPVTGLITASDQQGHYVPSTPLHVIQQDAHYGFQPTFLKPPPPVGAITKPLAWLPHSMNPSAAGQVWLTGAKMGGLNDALIHIGYNRPELFLVRMHERAGLPQASVVSLSRDLRFSPLAGAVNPIDGQLYVTGFQVWGTTAARISGLARIRHTGGPSPFPREIVATNKGVLLRFDVPIDLSSVRPENFTAQRWNYIRSAAYGSPHLKRDGTPGQEVLAISATYLSDTQQGVFVGIPDMQEVMQMQFSWSLASGGTRISNIAALTPHKLVDFDPVAEGFGFISVDLSARGEITALPATPSENATAESGRQLYETLGCSACHSTDGAMAGKVGPTWKGLAGEKRQLADGSHVLADEDYLRESILRPAAKIPSGFEHLDAGMPIYEGVLNDSQVRALVLFIQSLGGNDDTAVK